MQQKHQNKGHPCPRLNSWTSFSAFSCKWLNLHVPRLSFRPIIIFQACPLVLQRWVIWEFPNLTMKSASMWGGVKCFHAKEHTCCVHIQTRLLDAERREPKRWFYSERETGESCEGHKAALRILFLLFLPESPPTPFFPLAFVAVTAAAAALSFKGHVKGCDAHQCVVGCSVHLCLQLSLCIYAQKKVIKVKLMAPKVKSHVKLSSHPA